MELVCVYLAHVTMVAALGFTIFRLAPFASLRLTLIVVLVLVSPFATALYLFPIGSGVEWGVVFAVPILMTVGSLGLMPVILIFSRSRK